MMETRTERTDKRDGVGYDAPESLLHCLLLHVEQKKSDMTAFMESIGALALA